MLDAIAPVDHAGLADQQSADDLFMTLYTELHRLAREAVARVVEPLVAE